MSDNGKLTDLSNRLEAQRLRLVEEAKAAEREDLVHRLTKRGYKLDRGGLFRLYPSDETISGLKRMSYGTPPELILFIRWLQEANIEEITIKKEDDETGDYYIEW